VTSLQLRRRVRLLCRGDHPARRHQRGGQRLGAVAWSADSGFVEATHRPALEIYDRVGGGDSFAAGLVYGLLTAGDLQTAVDYGAAHGALAMTTPGDTSMASLAEVEALVAGTGARVQRLSSPSRNGVRP
jgi:sugar/nucleoside kinase (ribokinase family)